MDHNNNVRREEWRTLSIRGDVTETIDDPIHSCCVYLFRVASVFIDRS